MVLSHFSKNLKRFMDQCYSSVLFSKQRKIHPGGMRAGWPKRHKEKRSLVAQFWPIFLCFSPSPSLPYVNWASQGCCLFYLMLSLQSSDLPLFYFPEIFSSLSFRHHHSGLLFHSTYLTVPSKKKKKQGHTMFLKVGEN